METKNLSLLPPLTKITIIFIVFLLFCLARLDKIIPANPSIKEDVALPTIIPVSENQLANNYLKNNLERIVRIYNVNDNGKVKLAFTSGINKHASNEMYGTNIILLYKDGSKDFFYNPPVTVNAGTNPKLQTLLAIIGNFLNKLEMKMTGNSDTGEYEGEDGLNDKGVNILEYSGKLLKSGTINSLSMIIFAHT